MPLLFALTSKYTSRFLEKLKKFCSFAVPNLVVEKGSGRGFHRFNLISTSLVFVEYPSNFGRNSLSGRVPFFLFLPSVEV